MAQFPEGTAIDPASQAAIETTGLTGAIRRRAIRTGARQTLRLGREREARAEREEQRLRRRGRISSIIQAGGALLGGAVGTLIPGAGTLVGAGIGAQLGGAAGIAATGQRPGPLTTEIAPFAESLESALAFRRRERETGRRERQLGLTRGRTFGPTRRELGL
jgi:hypothetical protein